MDENIENDSAAEQLEGLIVGERKGWGVPHALDLLETITDRDMAYPCTFAVQGALTAGLRFGFVDDLHDSSSWEQLADVLREYLQGYQDISRVTSLIVFFGGDGGEGTLDEYYAKFWEILQYLHDTDVQPWPRKIPQYVDHPLWEFSFDGTPIFVVCSTPAHVQRRSRNSPVFLVTFQPQWVFEGLGTDTKRGQTARKVIRRRLVNYDEGMEPDVDLGGYGEPDNREWKQYFLADSNDERTPGCPFLHKQESGVR